MAVAYPSLDWQNNLGDRPGEFDARNPAPARGILVDSISFAFYCDRVGCYLLKMDGFLVAEIQRPVEEQL